MPEDTFFKEIVNVVIRTVRKYLDFPANNCSVYSILTFGKLKYLEYFTYFQIVRILRVPWLVGYIAWYCKVYKFYWTNIEIHLTQILC